MKDEDEVKAMLERVLDIYDNEAGKGRPTASTSAMRQALEWVLGDISDEDMDEWLDG